MVYQIFYQVWSNDDPFYGKAKFASPYFCMGKNVEKSFSQNVLNGSAQLNKMAIMPIYGKKKTLQNLLQNEESFENESWFIALGAQSLPDLFK